ncbi:DUF1266 domain-containing protein [Actinomadura miaoliensis]|uniref:DUF1266 domain-containing protein n=1 Tax=Actinomadura miaoliensis TaxID=430685 RepID=A0ABP7WW67_9ACTN
MLAGAGRMDEAVGRAVRSVSGFRAVQDHRRADRAAVHAARLALKRSGPRAAVPVLRELLALLVPASDGHRQVAGMLADAERQPDRDHDILLADPDVPTWGRFAHAMAVGAHLAVGNGVAWNSVTDGRETREENRRLLADSWSVTDSASWWEQMEALLKGENCDPAIQVVLDQRGDDGDRRAWHAAIGAWCRDREISPETIRRLVALADRIARYEERFRADGLLAPDARVDSVLGYDFGRAVNMARWGLHAGYVDHETAQGCVLRAAELARRVYSSWPSFSAGYVLGRMLRFDDGEFGDWYARSLTGHRILTQDPASPWRKLAWG